MRVLKPPVRSSKLLFYTGRGSLEGWLRTVMAQEFINRYRKQKRLVSLEEQTEEGVQFAVADPAPASTSGQRVESATDDCDETVIITNDAPGCFPTGVTTVTFTARDDAGNRGTCSADVNVVDTAAPSIALQLSRDVIQIREKRFDEAIKLAPGGCQRKWPPLEQGHA